MENGLGRGALRQEHKPEVVVRVAVCGGGAQDCSELLLGKVEFSLRDVNIADVVARAGRVGIELEGMRSEEHTSELQSHLNLVCRLLLEKKKKKIKVNSPLVKLCRDDRAYGLVVAYSS